MPSVRRTVPALVQFFEFSGQGGRVEVPMTRFLDTDGDGRFTAQVHFYADFAPDWQEPIQ